MKASAAGHMECVKVLLDSHAEVNIQNIVSGDIIYTLGPCNAACVHGVSPSDNHQVQESVLIHACDVILFMI